MKKIFWGLIFVLLNFNITLDQRFVINLIPNFIGYFFIAQGCLHLFKTTNIQEYDEVRKLSFILVGVSFFIYLADLFGFGAFNQLFGILLGAFSLVLFLYTLHRVTKCIVETSVFNLPEVLSTQLKNALRWIVITNILGFILIIAPLIAILILLIALVTHVLYIITINKIMKVIDPIYI